MSFKLIAQKDEGYEREYEAAIFQYLNTLRVKKLISWKNEEFQKPNKKYGEHRQRGYGLDIMAVCYHQGGRHIEIDVKTPTEFAFVMKHWDRMRSYLGKNLKYQRLKRQIGRVEMVEQHGGLAFFACSWLQVQEIFKREMIDVDPKTISEFRRAIAGVHLHFRSIRIGDGNALDSSDGLRDPIADRPKKDD